MSNILAVGKILKIGLRELNKSTAISLTRSEYGL